MVEIPAMNPQVIYRKVDFMGFIAPLSDSDPRIGGKARSMAQMASMGLATPAGFVVTGAVFRALCPVENWPQNLDRAGLQKLEEAEQLLCKQPWPAAFLGELHHALSRLSCARFAVRSSFVGEDMVGRLAAGVYTSELDVPFDKVEQAIRHVLSSAIAPGAFAYARMREIPAVADPIAVLIHAYLPGEACGSVAASTGEDLILNCHRGVLTERAMHLLRDAVFSWVKQHGPTEMEWVFEGGILYYLQARPYCSPQPAPDFAGFTELTDRDPPADAWHWDMAHNPLPLSPAQRGLVELVDRHCSIGIRQRVLGGYLFYTRQEPSQPVAHDLAEAEVALTELRHFIEDGRAKLEASPSLENAIALFLSVYQKLFGDIQPVLRLQRDELRAFLSQHDPTALDHLGDLLRNVVSVASERRQGASQIGTTEGEAQKRALERYRMQFGDEASVWDVAEATFGEISMVPGLARFSVPPVDWRSVADLVEAGLPETLWSRYRSLLANARKSMALSEEDDWLYARAQACVRHALRALAPRLCSLEMLQKPDDIFFLPLSEIRQWIVSQTASFDWKSRVQLLRAEWEHARQFPPILNPTVKGPGLIQGLGTGGRMVGRVLLHQPGVWEGLAKDRVLVARTILPMELPLLDVGALVVETGGLLDHVAVQARERNLPAIIGAAGATSIFMDGEFVLVDANRGIVVRLAET